MQAVCARTLQSTTRLFILFLLTFSTALAQEQTLTQQRVIQLLQLKTPENEVIEQIKKSGTVFVLGMEDIARLKRAGASDAVIAAMKGGETGSAADAAAFEISDLALVVDYSGSMSAKTKEGTTKMAAAKEAVGKLIDKLPGDINVAVIVYGVSKKRGCEDIDLVQPLGAISDKSALKSKLLGLANTGMTPIASSLELAGVALQKAKGGRAIVLVTDGVESCKGDPSAVASKLASEFGIKFGLHVIGFDIKADERASLEQIAKSGHGKYFNADNATELASAMQKVTQQVAVEPKQRDTVKYEASGQAVKGGLWFQDAPVIPAGEYSGSLAMKEARFYQVAVRKGQELRAIGTIKKTPLMSHESTSPPIHQDFVVAIYSPSLEQVAREENKTKDNPTAPLTLRATWAAENDGIAYVCIAASANYDSWNRDEGALDTKPEPSAYTLKVRAEGEPGVGTAPKKLDTKPGTNFATAGGITDSGIIPGDIKYGESAFFSAPVQKGEEVIAALAAQKPFQKRNEMIATTPFNATYHVIVYDDDQVEVARKSFTLKGNPPDPGAVSLSWPATTSGKASVVVTLDESKADVPTGPGRFALLVKKPGSESTSPSAGGSEPKLEKSDPLSGSESESTATPAEQSPTPKKKSQKDPFAGAEPESSPQ
jgi:Mg-chelatase subunit ChlD